MLLAGVVRLAYNKIRAYTTRGTGKQNGPKRPNDSKCMLGDATRRAEWVWECVRITFGVCASCVEVIIWRSTRLLSTIHRRTLCTRAFLLATAEIIERSKEVVKYTWLSLRRLRRWDIGVIMICFQALICYVISHISRYWELEVTQSHSHSVFLSSHYKKH